MGYTVYYATGLLSKQGVKFTAPAEAEAEGIIAQG